jgi:hypothetical protein
MIEQVKGKRGQVKWTFLVYMAGDNNLDGAALRDIAEMAKAGSTKDVNILVQIDRIEDQKTRRFRITQGGGFKKDCIQTFSETSTGDPQILYEFVKWAADNYPADRYALILWNHGSGWWEDARGRAAGPTGTGQPRRGGSRKPRWWPRPREKRSKPTARRGCRKKRPPHHIPGVVGLTFGGEGNMVHPIPGSGLAQTYLITDEKDGLMVIDVGSVGAARAVEDFCVHTIKRSLMAIRIIAATHFHIDHIGGIGALLEKCSLKTTILFHPLVKAYLKANRPLSPMRNWTTGLFPTLIAGGFGVRK